MTEKQKLFCEHYLQHFNGAEAIRAAGFQYKRPDAAAYDLLSKAEIKEYLAERTAKLFEEADISIKKVLDHLINMSFFDIRNIYDDDGALLPMSQWPDGAGQVVTSVKTEHRFDGSGSGVELVTVKEIKMAGREKTAEMLGRYLAMFTDNIRDVSDPKAAVVVYVPGFEDDDEDPED